MKRLFALVILAASLMPLRAQNSPAAVDNIEASFGFRSRDDDFYKFIGNNEDNIGKLFDFIDSYSKEIRSGKVKVYVSAYSADYELLGQNLNISKKRANRVKSFIILKKGLRESDFITSTFAARKGYDPTVTVSISIPEGVSVAQVQPKPQPKPEPDFGASNASAGAQNVVIPRDPKPTHKPVEEEFIPDPPKPVVKEVASERVRPVVAPKHQKNWAEPYWFSLRTNFLYYALLTPNIGMELRAAPGFGIKLAGGYSDWSWLDNNQKQNMKMVYGNAELRWYMGPKKRFYIGGSGNAFDLHLHWNMLNSLFGGKGRGYEGRIYNGGLIIGYQARLSNALSMDFNIGGGYNSMSYKEYVLDANGRKDYVDNGEERTKSILGPTQAEIALVWRFGRGR